MKKLMAELLKKHFNYIASDWESKIVLMHDKKLTMYQCKTFVESTMKVLIQIVETSDYSCTEQYMVDTYNLFSKVKFNLLQVSEIMHQGRYAVLHHFEKDETYNYDPLMLLGFIEEIIEQIYARYTMLYHDSVIYEVKTERDRITKLFDTSQQYLRNILHTTDSAIMVIDQDEKIVDWNKGAEEIFGYRDDEVIGQKSSLLFDSQEKAEEELDIIRSQIEDKGFVKINETERVDKWGNKIPVHLIVKKLASDKANYAGRSVVIKDLSELKTLKQQVDQSEKLAVLGQLSAGIAHEIGNPLASISSVVQILQRKAKEDFFKNQLASIKENLDRISKIVRELVDFSRPPGFKKQETQITDVLKTAIGIVKYDKRIKDVDFKTTLGVDIPKVNVVPDQLLQVFVNILFNALDAIDGSGVVEIKSYNDISSIYVEIKDNGCGIASDNVSKIFDPFFTTKEVGKGTGLGLSVSYGIIHKAKGEIKVESKLNEYSKFIIKLPILIKK